MIVGERLRVVREKKNLSEGDVENRTGLLRCYISRVENGHTVPSVETLEKLARSLEVPLYQLFYDGEGPPKIANVVVMKSPGSLEERLGQHREGCSLFQQASASIEQDRRRRLQVSSEYGSGKLANG